MNTQMADDEDQLDSLKAKASSTSASDGRVGEPETYLPLDSGREDVNSAHPLLAEHGGTRVVDPGLGMGLVLPFESEIQGHIGRQLRTLYDEMLQQPIPDRFFELLKQLDERSPSEDLKGED